MLNSKNSLNNYLPVFDRNKHLIYSKYLSTPSNCTDLLQTNNLATIVFHSTFLSSNLTKNINTFYIASSEEDKSYAIDTSPFDSFLFLRNSTVTSFFMTNLVDMPIAFKKSKSLYSKTFEIQTLKLSNLLMRDGKRDLVLKALTFVLGNLSQNWYNMFTPLNPVTQWLELYLALSNYNLGPAFKLKSANIQTLDDVFWDKNITKNRLEIKNTNFFRDILITKFEDFQPLFNFYIQKTDKSKIKNSRGKVSKLKLIWKYVPLYKRFYQALRWLLKDLKFQKSTSFKVRLLTVFETFCLTPQLSFLWKLRNFVHFFVFRNFKKTLLRTLQSTS